MVQLRSDASANRARLIAAAREMFAERGLDAEMKEIAERAGVGIGTIYRNFATKDDLIEAVVGEVARGFSDATTKAIEIDDPVEAIRAYIAEASAVIEQHQGMVGMMLSGQTPSCLGPMAHAMISDTRMRSVIERGISRGVFASTIDPVIAASALLGLMHPLAFMSAGEERTTAQVRDGLMELFVRAMRV